MVLGLLKHKKASPAAAISATVGQDDYRKRTEQAIFVQDFGYL